jgi:hypothetical protein
LPAGNDRCALPAHPKEQEEFYMATKRPSFLKRQKEQKRTARALEKREARRGKKLAKEAERAGAPMGELPS